MSLKSSFTLPGGVTEGEIETPLVQCISSVDRVRLASAPDLKGRMSHPLLVGVSEMVKQDVEIRRLLMGVAERSFAFLRTDGHQNSQVNQAGVTLTTVSEHPSQTIDHMTTLGEPLLNMAIAMPRGQDFFHMARRYLLKILAGHLKSPTMAEDLILYPAVDDSLEGRDVGDIVNRARDMRRDIRCSLMSQIPDEKRNQAWDVLLEQTEEAWRTVRNHYGVRG